MIFSKTVCSKEKIINEKMATELKKLLKEICKEMHIEIIKGKIEENGVKLKINTPPNLSVSEIVKQIKGKTSKIILKENTLPTDSFKLDIEK